MSFAPKLGATVSVAADTQSSAVAFESPPGGDFKVRVVNNGDAVSFVNFGALGVTADPIDDLPMPAKSVEVFDLSSTALTPITHAAAITTAGQSAIYFTPTYSEAQYDYLVTNDGDATTANSFASVLALGAPALSGKTVGVQPLAGGARYSKKTFSLDVTTQPVTFQALGANCRIDRIKFDDNAAEIILDGFEILSYQIPMTEPVIEQINSPGPFTIKNSPRVAGNIGDGDPLAAFNPDTNLYKELGNVVAIVDEVTGAITGGEVYNPYIGDNWTGDKTDPLNGTITFEITKGRPQNPGSGASGITIQVVDGYLQEQTIQVGNGGSGYLDTTNELTTLFKIPGAVRFSDKMSYIFQVSPPSIAHGRATFLNNYVTLGRRGLVGHENMHIEGNWFDNLMGDQVQIGGANALLFDANPLGTVVTWNTFSRAFVRGFDYGNPHCDYIQLGGNNTRLADWNVRIEGNVMLTGQSRSSGQGIFLSDMVPPHAYTGRVCNNFVVIDESINCLNVEESKDLIVYGNTVARYDHSNAGNANTASVNFPGSTSGTVIVGCNIAEGYTGLAPRIRTELDPNASLLRNDAADYLAKFAAPDTQPATRDALIAAYASIGSVSSKGAGRTGGHVNWAARTVDLSGEPVAATFDNLQGAPISSSVPSNVARIVGGPDTGTFEVTGPGFAVQFADDAAFTQNVTPPATSGAYARGKYARMACNTGSAGVTTVNGALTLNGWLSSWSVTTASVLSYVGVDNGGAVWSKMSSNLGAGVHNKLVLSAEVRLDALSNRVIAGRTATNDYLGVTTGPILQVLLGGGTNFNIRTSTALSTGWRRIILVADMAAGINGVTVMFDNTLAAINTSTSVVNAAGSLNLANLFNGGWGLMSHNTGATVLDGAFRYLFWHSWSGGPAVPDLSSQSLRDEFYNKFSADLINLANGSGPLGVQPLGFWRAQDLTEANSAGGIANRGSGPTTAFIKQTVADYTAV